MKIPGHPVSEGVAKAELLVSPEPITFYGGVDPLTSKVTEPGHPLYGEVLKDRILVFPHSKGSTVGSYIILRLARRGIAPAGIVTLKPDEVVIVGCVIGGVPSMTGISEEAFNTLRTGDKAELRVDRNYAELLVEEL
ncbi:MAG: aconitase X swivel domain-containing protein [Infirmifilum sp.]|jgi:predicted aconitase with swiveling domain|uniref:phosphomevalonate dehydratase n=1 Tax=Infirmifilum uzonense TaxID=1550241 RepID=A0A0F7FIU7_9CREN|nr:DUF126 domain-containing protein [Infirmifilum uzonense]AKG38847.1 hypothetical protein MA03_05620 [Infirmifilum uzonense]